MVVSSRFHGCQGSGGDKTSELLQTSDKSSSQRVKGAELSNCQSGRVIQVIVNELGIMDGSGCIVVIGHNVMSGI